MNVLGPFLDLTKQVLQPDDGNLVQVPGSPRPAIATSSGTPFWGTNPGAYETVRFAKNIILPGQCKVTGKGFEQRLQKDKAPGTHGASVKSIGMQPAKISIVVRMWTEDHLRAFEALVPLLKMQKYTQKAVEEVPYWTAPSFPGKPFSGVLAPETVKKSKTVHAGPKPIDVYHPMLAMFRVRSVHIESISIPQPSSEPEVWEATIACEEFIYRPTAVKAADESLAITEKTVGKTAFTLAMESKNNAPPPPSATVTASPVYLPDPGKPPYPVAQYRAIDKW